MSTPKAMRLGAASRATDIDSGLAQMCAGKSCATASSAVDSDSSVTLSDVHCSCSMLFLSTVSNAPVMRNSLLVACRPLVTAAVSWTSSSSSTERPMPANAANSASELHALAVCA